jgi:penicillin-binding protein 2
MSNFKKIMTRRAFLVGAGQLSIFGVLAGRLGWLQLHEGERYKTLSEKNRVDLRMIAPTRGLIYDRAGLPFAINEQDFHILVVPEQVEDLEKSLEILSSYIDLRPSEIERAVAIAEKQPDFIPVEIKDNLDWQQVSTVEVNVTDLPGIYVAAGQRRAYPMGVDTAHIVGYVGAVDKNDLKKGDPVLKLPGFRIGKTGLEKSYEEFLRGEAGHKKVEVNVAGREVRDLETDKGVSGHDMATTIDSRLQSVVMEVLSETKSASAVVMNPNTGEVYAMASYPAFDANKFTSGISFTDYEALLADDGKPLNNKAVSGQYPPGSTFKMVTALAGLEAGVINEKTSVYCPGHYDINEHRFHCWKRSGHGWVDLVQALGQSCDVYFYDMAREVGIDKIAEMARKLGLDQEYGFDLREEMSGLMPDKNWKRGHLGEKWRPGETVVASIGQGYILSTPLQLAVMTSRLCNGGKAVKPWMVGAVDDQLSSKISENWPSLDINPYHLKLVKRGMQAVVNHEKGTANSSAITVEGQEMAGKTGTSQVRRISRQQRSEGLVAQEDIPWKFRHHALFVGYAPMKKPDYVVSVVVEHGGSGSAAAAPLAQKILKKAQELDVKNVKISKPSEIKAAEALHKLKESALEKEEEAEETFNQEEAE